MTFHTIAAEPDLPVYLAAGTVEGAVVADIKSYFRLSASYSNVLMLDRDRGEPADDRIFSDPNPWRGFQPRVFVSYFSDRGHCDQLMVIAQKPDKDNKAEVVRIQASGCFRHGNRD